MLAVILLWFSYWRLYCCHLESCRWQSEIQLQRAYGEQLLSANCTQLHTAGSMRWVTSDSTNFVQNISTRRYMCALGGLLLSDLLHYWSGLHESFAIAKAAEVKVFLRQEGPASCSYQRTGEVSTGSHEGTFVPTAMASLFRNQLLCGRLEV